MNVAFQFSFHMKKNRYTFEVSCHSFLKVLRKFSAIVVSFLGGSVEIRLIDVTNNVVYQ